MEQKMLGYRVMIRLPIVIVLLSSIISGCLGQSAMTEGATLTGKVTNRRLPQAGVVVRACSAEAISIDRSSCYASEKTGDDGRFLLTAPPGEYYLFAEGEDLFAYYGRNPATLSSSGLSDLSLGLVAVTDPLPAEDPFIVSGVAGRITYDGVPLAGVTIYVYTDLTSRLKGMGYTMAGPTDKNGYFEVELPAGSYYLLARLRQGGGETGPLRPGDFIGYSQDNPVTVEEGGVNRVSFAVLELPEKGDEMQKTLFGSTGIRGRIVDTSGNPVAGARAVLYDDPQMLDRPLYVSPPTSSDGAFFLSFPEGGTYFLAARNTLGGSPSPGDLYGTYDRSPDHSLKIATGEVCDEVKIVVEEMW